MKKMMILAMMMVMTVSASAMRYSDARREALFLSDKMAYELNLTDAQYAAVYEINLDYLMSVDSRSVYGSAAMPTCATCSTAGSTIGICSSPTSIVRWLGTLALGCSASTIATTAHSTTGLVLQST